MIGNIALFLAGFLLTVLVLMGLLDATHGTPVSFVSSRGDKEAPGVDDPLFLDTIEIYTTTPIHDGHEIEIFHNGDSTYPRLWADIRAAKRFVVVQMYYCKKGKVADQLHEILCDRARAGVDVLFLHDSFGSSLKGDYVKSLKEAGVEVARFRPMRIQSLNTVRHRAHIRAVVIDAEVGYTGGFGIDDKWLGDGRTDGQWRDTNVRFTGPAVAQLLGTFGSCWAEATGELIAGHYFAQKNQGASSATGEQKSSAPPENRKLRSGSSVVAGLLHAVPTVGSTDAERFFALSIASSKRKLYITNSYFVPDDDFRRMLTLAAKRGVDVRVLASGPKTDVKSTYYAGRAIYTELLKSGVRIYEYMPTVLHAKTMMVDDSWGTVGTMNADNQSMAFNNESNLLVLDKTFAAALEKLYMEDLKYSKEITLDEFRKRPWYLRPVEHAAHLVARIL
jgi:cardiolipin synthase A/B